MAKTARTALEEYSDFQFNCISVRKKWDADKHPTRFLKEGYHVRIFYEHSVLHIFCPNDNAIIIEYDPVAGRNNKSQIFTYTDIDYPYANRILEKVFKALDYAAHSGNPFDLIAEQLQIQLGDLYFE